MKAWRVALTVIGACLVGYHLGADGFLWFPGADADMASFSEAVVRWRSNHHQIAPAVLCLGSSRMRHGLVEEVIEKAYGLSPGSVQNYGMDVGTPWMALKFLERTDLLAGPVRVVFLDVEPWQFNAAFPTNDVNRQIFYRLASMREKMRSGGWQQKAFFLADALVPFVSENRPLKLWAEGVQYLTSERAVRSLEVPHAWRRRRQRLDERFSPLEAAKRHMEGYRFEERMRQALLEVVERLAGKGVALVMLQMPVDSRYLDAIKNSPEFGGAYAEYLDWIRGLNQPERGVWVMVWERPEEIGLDDRAFIDYGHFSRESAPVFTRQFLSRLPAAVSQRLAGDQVAGAR